MASGDEREKELQRQIDKLTDRDASRLTKVIVDIAKESKGLDENFNVFGNLVLENNYLHRNTLKSLLFEEESDFRKSSSVGYPVSKVIDHLKAASVLAYDNELTPGSEVFEKAEEFTISTVCAILRSTCDINVTGVEKYKTPTVVAAKAETYAKASVNVEAPVGQPSVPSMAAMTADAGMPQMNQQITPQQFASVLNNSGGENAKMFTRFMMYHMLLQQTGGDSNRAMKQLEQFLQAMGEGKLTSEQAFDQVGEIISNNPVGTDAAADADSEGSAKKEKIANAFKDALNTVRETLPTITQENVVSMLQELQIVPAVIENPQFGGVLEVSDKGKKIFSNKITDKTIANFVKNNINHYFNIGEESKVSDSSVLADQFKNSLFNSAQSVLKINKEKLEKYNGSQLDDSKQNEFAKQIDNIIEKFVTFRILNKIFGTSLENNSTDIKAVLNAFSDNDKIKELSRIIFNAFKTTKFKESRASRKPVIDNRVRRRKEVIKEEYLMGNLSNLLFENSVVVESKSSKSKEISDSNINLRREWLKIWDI